MDAYKDRNAETERVKGRKRARVVRGAGDVLAKSNPVDGLSRGQLDGPWKVESLAFPGSLLRPLRSGS